MEVTYYIKIWMKLRTEKTEKTPMFGKSTEDLQINPSNKILHSLQGKNRISKQTRKLLLRVYSPPISSSVH